MDGLGPFFLVFAKNTLARTAAKNAKTQWTKFDQESAKFYAFHHQMHQNGIFIAKTQSAVFFI